LKKKAYFALMMLVSSALIVACSSLTRANSIIWPDWTGIAPIVHDTLGDESPNYDITDCYVTDDGVYLFFKIMVDGTSIIKEATYVLLDVDRNTNTGDNGSGANTIDSGLTSHSIGADYMLDSTLTADLYQWEAATGWQPVKLIPYQIIDNSLELAVLWTDIGSPTQINIVFLSNPPHTDFAPNQKYVTYPQFVGGSIYGADRLKVLTPVIAEICLVTAAIGAIAIFRKRC
jgi:hypothetical protein